MLIGRSRQIVLAIVASLASMMACSQESTVPSESETFVLVHGAWHGAWAYEALSDQLAQKGHAVVAVDLPGHGLDMTPAREVTLELYVEKVVGVIDSIDMDVILVGHSMGGIVVSQVTEARAERIKHLVFIAGFMPRNGETMLSLALQDTESMVFPNLVYSEDGSVSFFLRDGAREVFYNDCAEDVASAATLRLNSQPMAPYTQALELSPQRYGTVPRTYIRTLKDNAVSPGFQQQMIEWSPPNKVILMDTGHSPFLSKPEELASALTSLLGAN